MSHTVLVTDKCVDIKPDDSFKKSKTQQVKTEYIVFCNFPDLDFFTLSSHIYKILLKH